MRATIKPGEELDFATPAEVRDILDESLAPWARGPQTIRAVDAVTLDGSGNGQVDVYGVPAGHRFTLHRLLIDLDAGSSGYNPGHPYTSSTGYADILRAGVREGFAVFSGGLPCLFTDGSRQALEYSNGEVVSVLIVGGPPDGTIIVRLQGTIQPVTVN